MPQKSVRYFLVSAAVVLFITAAAKLISSVGGSPLLLLADPLFGVPFRLLFWIVAGVEVAVGIVCLARKRTYIQAGLLAWLGTNFAAYRIGLLLIGYHTCPCLGSLTDALRLSRHMADTILKIVLAYLLIGSYVVLCCLWLQRRKDARVADGRE